MSKSKGNIVNPSEIYNKYGADTLRLYILFIGPADSMVDWSNKGVEGSRRFLKRFWRIISDNIEFIGKAASSYLTRGSKAHPVSLESELKKQFLSDKFSEDERELLRKLHQTIKKVTGDILKRFNFNTAISAIMELINLMSRYVDETPEARKNAALLYEVTSKVLILFSPIAPFITEELWQRCGRTSSIHRTDWPSFDKDIAREQLVTIVFQVNGKLRDRVELPAGTSAEELESAALAS